MNKNHVIATLAAIIFVDEVIIAPINKRRMERLKKAYLAAENKSMYFATLMDRHKVPFTEFDQIAVDSYYENV